MTRRKALTIVLKYLENAPISDENLCIAKKTLQEMCNGFPGKIWDDESIRAAVERFIRENGRPPKVKELDTVLYLPPHPCVQRMYGMTAGKWLFENYPPGENGRSGVSLFLGIVPVLAIAGELQGDLTGREFGFLQAEAICINGRKEIGKPLAHAGAEAIDVPGNEFHWYVPFNESVAESAYWGIGSK